MERILFFVALQVAVSGYALLRGGGPERLTASALLVGAAATRLLLGRFAPDFVQLEFGVLLVDLVLLAVLVTTTLYADRYWTFWLTSLHALGAGAHLVKLLDPDVLRTAYGILAAGGSYPMLLLLGAGTFRHRDRIRRLGRDLDWSSQAEGWTTT